MERQIRQKADALLKSKKKKKLWHKAISVMAAVVVFCTVYALILPAVTLSSDTVCGQVEHTHTDDCYIEEQELSCQLPEGEGHAHTEECYAETRTLSCGLEESEDHTHTDECYTQDRELVCGQEEAQAHTHTGECYTTSKTLNCKLPEHTHTEECYAPGDATASTQATEPTEQTDAASADLLSTDDGIMPYADAGGTTLTLHPGEVYTVDVYSETVISDNENIAVVSAKENEYSLKLGSDNTFADSTAVIEDALYTFTGDNDSGYTVQAGNVYLNLGTAGCPGKTTVSSIKFEGRENNSFSIYSNDDSKYLYFHRSGGKAYRFDRNGSYDDESCHFLIYRRATEEDALSGEIPGYVQITSVDEIKSGNAYLIVAEAGGAYYVLFPSTSTESYYAHVAKVAPYALTIEAKGVGTATVTAGDMVIAVTVTDEITLGADKSTQIQLPAGAQVGIEDYDSGIATVEVDKNNLVTIAGVAKGNTTASVKVGDVTYTWNITVTPRTSFTLTYGGAEVTFNLMDKNNEAIECDVTDIVAESAKRYIFGAKDPSTAEEDNVEDCIAPDIPGYTLKEAQLVANPKVVVYSVATSGYNNGSVRFDGSNPLRFYGTEPATEEIFFTREAGRWTVNLIYVETPITTTVTPAGTVINLFDYWVTGKNEGQVSYSVKNAEKGINAGHALKFNDTNADAVGTANKWTGSNGGVLQGIVKNQLGEDGYPQLSGGTVFSDGSSNITESLAYLFEPSRDVTVNGETFKASYPNVGGLLQIDKDGYYYYDSTQNYAEYYHDNASGANRFRLYDNWAVQYNNGNKGEFFPFDPYSTVDQSTSAGNDDTVKLNHFLGMTLTTRFVQQNGGYTDDNQKTPTMFEFSGDDDVWIFIDDVLVADLGGIHEAAGVNINFADGTVTIDNVYQQGTSAVTPQTTYFTDIFTGADVALEKGTFKDGTYHTLKFYYLERGGNASNLKLKYNLTSYPTTGIYKVNQYGQTVEDAMFAVYAADGDYNLLNDLGGSSVDDLSQYTCVLSKEGIPVGSNAQIGDFIDSSGAVRVKSLFTGTTDSTGQMVFEGADGTPYTLDELLIKFGEHFILKEIAVPDGYRQVSSDIYLRITTGDTRMLLCANPYESGTWATPTLQITAPNTLQLVKDNKTQQYVQDETTNGSVFAVVLKYIGDDLGSASVDNLKKQENWAPVYGAQAAGFTVVDVGKDYGGDFTAAAIDIAQKYVESDNVFRLNANGAMVGGLDGMPGDISTYYYMLGEDEKGKTRYTVAYYWTKVDINSDGWSNVTTDNTFLINTDSDVAELYQFRCTFGSTIEVPNLNNRMYAQKFNEAGQRVDGATFAMYEVNEDTSNGKIYYVANDGSTKILLGSGGGNEETATVGGETGTYEVDPDSGDITVKVDSKTYTISPAKNAFGNALIGVTSSNSTSGEGGTCDFDALLEGTYYMREIKAPVEYDLNPTEVMVRVTANAIYANAGTEDDGVRVARGPGYVVSTLHQFASDGEIDKTLTWIYGMLRVNKDAVNTFQFASTGSWPYATDETGTKTTDQKDGAYRTYLKYAPQDGDKVLFNYTLNTDKVTTGENGKVILGNDLWRENSKPETALVAGTRRLYTDVGWSYLALYQDTAYADTEYTAGVNYEDLKDQDISNLFSRSVFVQVTDSYQTADLTIYKTDEGGASLSGAKFVLYREIDNVRTYYQYDESTKTTTWITADEDDLSSVTTEAKDGKLDLKQVQVGTYYLKEVQAPTGYNAIADITFKVTGTEDGTKIAYCSLNEGGGNGSVIGDGGLSITVPNTLITTTVTAEKTWVGASGTNQLVTLYLYRKAGTGDAELVDTRTLGDANPETGNVTSGGIWSVNGWKVTWDKLPAYGLVDGTMTEYQWYIREDQVNGYRTGYSSPTENLTVENSTISAARAEPDTSGVKHVTVTNTVSYLLPDTGGSGTARYPIIGAMLMLGAFLCGLCITKRSKRGGAAIP